MRQRTNVALAIGLVTLGMAGRPAWAVVASRDLVLVGASGGGFTGATPTGDVTNDTTVFVSPAGMNFSGTTDNVAYCKFHLPIDFDSADANQPYIRVTGWAIDDTTCGADGTSKTVRLEATSRAFGSNVCPTDSWPTEDFADATLTCTPNYFGTGLDGIKSDQIQILYIDATADGSDWDAEDFVEIKIRRNTGTDTYGYNLRRPAANGRNAMFRNATISLCTLILGLPIASLARDRPPAQGAAIGLEYSIQHDVMRPGEDVTLLLCLTNANTHSSRDVAPGDSFSFALREGIVHGCGGLSVHSPDGSLAASDFICDAVGNSVRLTFNGAVPARWPLGNAACVLVPYSVGSGPSTVMATMDVSNQGAFLAPSPSALLLSVAPGLGTAGPPGAAGSAGPAGIPGPSGVGHWVFASSTGAARARDNEPPLPVPGLDVVVDVAAGSSVEVMADTITIDCDPPGGTGHRQDNTGIAIEVDGVVSAQRSVPVRTVGTLVHGDPMVIHWISGALAAGSHRVRVLVTAPHPPDPLTDYYSFCVGSAANDEYQARLSVKELLPVP